MKPKIGGMVILCLDSSYKIRKLHNLSRSLVLFWQTRIVMEAMLIIMVKAIFYLLEEN